jgi:hypothetical protein
MDSIYSSSYADQTNEEVLKRNTAKRRQTHTSSLSGAKIPIEQFTHNNMMPYYRGSVKQNTDVSGSHQMLERFNGTGEIHMKKQEVEHFGDVSSDMTNVYGAPVSTDFEQSRMVQPTTRNNVLPFTPVRVAPGVGLGAEGSPSHGFDYYNPDDVRERTVDDLRARNNPKLTFEGITLEGQKGAMMGKIGVTNKYTADSFYEQGSERYFTTVAGVQKEAQRACQILKNTTKPCTHTEYEGTAYQNKGDTARSIFGDPKRQQFTDESAGERNKESSSRGVGSLDDYKMDFIQLYSNQRDNTACNTYQSNLTTFVKSLTMPFTEIITLNKKVLDVDPSRAYGSLQSTVPEKATIYDRNDVLRTTIKETNIHDNRTGNVELHKKIVTYNPNEIAKRTLRETLKNVTNDINISSEVPKQTIYDPEDKLKTTMKETTEVDDKIGFLGGKQLQNRTGYANTEFNAKDTNKQFTSVLGGNYYGTKNKNNDGIGSYNTEEYDLPDTNKQITSDYEYFSQAESAYKKDTSYEDVYNMCLNDVKQRISVGRIPTTEGKKVLNNTVNLEVKCEEPNSTRVGNYDKLYDLPLIEPMKLKHDKDALEDTRLDTSLLKPLEENPYSFSLSSAPSLTSVKM